jgi:hypothetical protein
VHRRAGEVRDVGIVGNEQRNEQRGYEEMDAVSLPQSLRVHLCAQTRDVYPIFWQLES